MRDFRQIKWDEQLVDDCRQLIHLAVREDLDRGHDWTTVVLVPSGTKGQANVVARRGGVICGLKAAALVAAQTDLEVVFSERVADGSVVAAGQIVASLAGPARSLLTIERIVLNFIGRLSGISSLTAQFVAAASGTRARIYDTRKTTPGWRRLEKYAVRAGGGHNHRTGLFDAVLIKDNHLAVGTGKQARYSPAQAVRCVRQFLEGLPQGEPAGALLVEVEVESLSQLAQVLPEGPDVVLLDNMPLDQLRQAVALRDERAPAVELEASGGISLASLPAIAATGVERISAGALTHSAAWLDVALDWDADA